MINDLADRIIDRIGFLPFAAVVMLIYIAVFVAISAFSR